MSGRAMRTGWPAALSEPGAAVIAASLHCASESRAEDSWPTPTTTRLMCCRAHRSTGSAPPPRPTKVRIGDRSFPDWASRGRLVFGDDPPPPGFAARYVNLLLLLSRWGHSGEERERLHGDRHG